MAHRLPTLISVALLLAAGASHAGLLAAQKCEIAKDKAAAKKYACLLAVREAAIAGKAADPARCSAAFAASFASAEAAAARAGSTCPVPDDAVAIERRIDVEQAGTAQLVAGAGRFHDNGDGTITDAQTGLMWEKKSADGSVHDQENLYTFTASAGGSAADGTLFTAFLATLNAGGGFAGHTDWRIPTMAELPTILDYAKAAPSVPNEFNGCTPGCPVATCSCTEDFFYWSLSAPPDDVLGWAAGFGFGNVDTFERTSALGARAVRGGG